MTPLTVKLGGLAGAHAAGLRTLTEHATSEWVIVHGGGAEVADWSTRLGLTPQAHDGLRVTDAATLEVVLAVLRGLVNARLVAAFNAQGKQAIGLSGADARLLSLQPADEALGYVGHVTGVDLDLLGSLQIVGLIPIVAPVAADANGQLRNVNADEAAGAIAAARNGRLLLLTDVPAVERHGQPVESLDVATAQEMLEDGTASGGMRPKLRAAIVAATAGCEVRIVDGRDPTAISAALNGEPIGTEVTAGRIGLSVVR
ncbi:MAG TPA: acetylglutamate kinase [Candidatus Limnocylindria bacterium]|nr:acetylglutamate kinase [Candidatus Limnocylindria bacterium]